MRYDWLPDNLVLFSELGLNRVLRDIVPNHLPKTSNEVCLSRTQSGVEP